MKAEALSLKKGSKEEAHLRAKEVKQLRKQLAAAQGELVRAAASSPKLPHPSRSRVTDSCPPLPAQLSSESCPDGGPV